MDSKIILEDDPDIAVLRNDISGWVALDGTVYASEASARYASATHLTCASCGEIYRKSAWCTSCSEARYLRKWQELPVDCTRESGYMYSDVYEEFFESLTEAIRYLRDQEPDIYSGFTKVSQVIEEMRLEWCKQEKPRELTEDFFYDQIYDDAELPAELMDAIQAFNVSITGISMGWVPGGTQVGVPDGSLTLEDFLNG